MQPGGGDGGGGGVCCPPSVFARCKARERFPERSVRYG